MSAALVAIAFVGSCVAQKCTDAALDAAWSRILAAYKKLSGAPLTPEALPKVRSELQGNAEIRTLSEAVFEHSTALRRARMVSNVVTGARVLWIDDRVENNTWERALLKSLGIEVLTVEKTQSAVRAFNDETFDLVISDIKREGRADEGVRALPAVKTAGKNVEVIFYVGVIDSNAAPPDSFGITNEPNELLHLVLDVLERRRI